MVFMKHPMCGCVVPIKGNNCRVISSNRLPTNMVHGTAQSTHWLRFMEMKYPGCVVIASFLLTHTLGLFPSFPLMCLVRVSLLDQRHHVHLYHSTTPSFSAAPFALINDGDMSWRLSPLTSCSHLGSYNWFPQVSPNPVNMVPARCPAGIPGTSTAGHMKLVLLNGTQWSFGWYRLGISLWEMPGWYHNHEPILWCEHGTSQYNPYDQI